MTEKMPAFRVSEKLFELFPDACFGVVIVEGARAGEPCPLLEPERRAEIARVQAMFRSIQEVRDYPGVAAWREAFTRLGWNPNRFPSSIEALLSRVAKGGAAPSINAAVDCGNVVSLRHLVPIGAHDIDSFEGDIEVRPAREGDTFTPFGSLEAEAVPRGEIVYASGDRVRTRRWVWRQSEIGKIAEPTRRVFFPIDGFHGKTSEQVRAARADLAVLCRTALGAERVAELWVDADAPCVDLGTGL